MSPRRGLLRVVLLFWSVLQLGAPAIAASADAVAAAASVTAHAHVESRTGATCVRVHDAECVFCQFLSTGATLSRTAPAAVPVATRFAWAPTDLATPRTATLGGTAHPRAPPTV